MSRQVDIRAIVSHIVRGDGQDKCRICMGDTTEGQVYLGDTVMVDGERAVTLSELLETITGVEVESSTLLPNQVCLACFKLALSAFPFIELCKDSQKKWLQLHDFIEAYTIPPGTKNLYITINENIQAVIESKRTNSLPAKNNREVLQNYKRLTKRKKYYKKKVSTAKDTIKKGELKCPDCSTAFSSAHILGKHLRFKGLKLCVHCTRTFKFEDMAEHLKLHGISVVFPCEKCNDVYEDEFSLQKHSKLFHRKGTAVCVHCKKSFTSAESLSSHYHIHTIETCLGCDKKLIKSCFKRHKCSNPRKARSKLVCDYCSKEYTFKAALKSHILTIHMNKKGFQCHLCGVTCRSRATLLEHDNIHNRIDDRYVCECGAKYSTRRGYQRHLTEKHGIGVKRKPKTYKCEVCCKIFKYKWKFEQHKFEHDSHRVQVKEDIEEIYVVS